MEDAVAFSSDGRLVAFSGYKDGVKLCDAASGRQIASLAAPESKGTDCLAFGPGDKFLVVAGVQGIITFWDVAKRRISHRWDAGKDEWIHMVALSPDGRLLATASAKQVLLWDIAAAKNVARFDATPNTGQGTQFRIWALKFSPDGKMLVVGGGGTGKGLLALLNLPVDTKRPGTR